MRILFDQGTPVPLRYHLSGHRISTAHELGRARTMMLAYTDKAKGSMKCLVDNQLPVALSRFLQSQNVKDMKIAVGSDDRTHLTDIVIEMLRETGHEVSLFGPLAGDDMPWPVVSQKLAESIVSGEAEEGVLFCWTGTGASIAANKVPGIRAALVRDAETAKGARWWNDANVLVMSLRATSEAIAKEILEVWFSEHCLPEEREFIEQVRGIERRYSRESMGSDSIDYSEKEITLKVNYKTDEDTP